MSKATAFQAEAGRSRSDKRSLLTRGSPHNGSTCFPVVSIGASAGDLEACNKLLGALPLDNGMAFILVQHIEPTHESVVAGPLAHRIAMAVVQAIDGILLERDHLYIIPPGSYVSISNGALHFSAPEAPDDAQLPFDFLLHSLAKECGEYAACVILSGTGSDGSLGLRAIKEEGGFVIAQHPDEAASDGMPRSAIKTGVVDLVLPLSSIPDALIEFCRRMALTRVVVRDETTVVPDWMLKIVGLLQKTTSLDFRLYKESTLQRRIARRMAMASIETDDIERYLDLLRNDEKELSRLAADLLINVPGFFGDRAVFDVLSEKIIPDMVRNHSIDQPLRLWIVGCSTGEETYCLAMLFLEAIGAAKRDVKLKIFATDVDADAVAMAREGLYPETIAAAVSAVRLARFFSKDDQGYRILPELRATVIFAVRDGVGKPPFHQFDLVLCRNLLSRLRPEAQDKAISCFHSALREGGILLLQSAETIGVSKDHFEIISKAERIYRHTGRLRSRHASFLFGTVEGARPPSRLPQGQRPSRQVMLAEGCRDLIIEHYAPAAVLIDRKLGWLYSLGPTERYLRVPRGYPSYDLLALVRPRLRIRLRAAIHRAMSEKARIVIPGGWANHEGKRGSFEIAVQPALIDGEPVLLVCFVDEPPLVHKRSQGVTPPDAEHVAKLEQQLEVTQTELEAAIHSLETSSEDQNTVNEEALFANEAYRLTNEELTALNNQLEDTLERQRIDASELRNILYSTGAATIFLDRGLNIRFFTPATKSLFNILLTDIGRPLADLNPLTDDSDFLVDARAVLQTLAPIERQIQAQDNLWYARRILPYLTQDGWVEGVIITFTDITERYRVADALKIAREEAQRANIAKSCFLAAASHDLRQPMQALNLMHGVLTRKIQDDKKDEALALVARLDETSAAMSGMLNTLLNINQLEAGTVQPQCVNFLIDDVLDQLRDEFTYHAGAEKLILRVVRCGLSVYSDPRLLEQMLRNLLSNAVKYTTRGKVLLGCRRRGGTLRIEVWDTNIGITDQDRQVIFGEYHQLGNATHQRSLGVGLGLSIVKRLATLLGHPIHVSSQPGKGSVFSIDVMRQSSDDTPDDGRSFYVASTSTDDNARRAGTILIIEDDAELRALLEAVLKEEGHAAISAPDGVSALYLLNHGTFSPDLILADYNVPNDMDGLVAAMKIRETLHRQIPVIILTGDISTSTLQRIASHGCVQLNKPVKTADVMKVIQRLLPISPPMRHPPLPCREIIQRPETPVIFVVDDDSHFRQTLRTLLEADGRRVEDFATCEAFLEAYDPSREGCLLVDAYLPGMTGHELLQRIRDRGYRLPAIMVTGSSDVPMAVAAMKAGALDFIEKPVRRDDLLAGVRRALEQARDTTRLSAWRSDASMRVGKLTLRQRQIMDMVLAGHPSKNIAADLGISQRTVENHRALIMKKMGARSLPALARLALAAVSNMDRTILDGR